MSSALISGSRCRYEHVVFPFWGIVRRQRGHVAYSPAAEGIPRARGRFHPAPPPSALVRGIELAARSSAESGSPTRGCWEADPLHSTDTVPLHPPFQWAPMGSAGSSSLLFAPCSCGLARSAICCLRCSAVASRTCSVAVLGTSCAAASRASSTKTPSCRLRREQVNNLLFTQIRLLYVLKDGMQPVCFLTRDLHNEIKESCCPRIRAPEMQQIHEQKRVRSLQQIEAIFIQTKCTHSRKIEDCNFSIRIPHITRVDSTRCAT